MLPDVGRPLQDLLDELTTLRAADGGSRPRSAAHDAAMVAYAAMEDVDCLDPGEAPSTVALERAVVATVASRLGGGAQTPGIFTNGGTESIMLATKAARDSHPEIHHPVLLVPVTAHAAFHKAAAYLGLRVHTMEVNPLTCQPDPARIAAAMTADTVLVGVSAPSAAYGVVDPISAIALAAAERGVCCHVDACAGGWVLPWLAEAGAQTPAFDLTVPGVSSISCDLHKFGGTPKSSSVVLFADEALRRAAYHACARWSGYTTVTPTVQSGRSAGPLAAAWTSLQFTGADGYASLGRSVLLALHELKANLIQIPGLRMLGDPTCPIVAFTSDSPDVDIFVVADEAQARGLSLGRQLGNAGLPPSLRINLARAGADVEVRSTLTVLQESVDAARVTGRASGNGPLALVAGALSGLDLAMASDAAFADLLRSVGLFPDAEPANRQSPPAGTAVINHLLNGLPPVLREQVLLRYTSVLFSHLAG